MALYMALKHLHITLVALSLSLFAIRGVWLLARSPRLQQRWVRITPHIIDTLLLTAGLSLAVYTGQNPAQQPWLAAKLLALPLYIGLGIVAFRTQREGTRRVALGGAVLCAAYMVTVAITKSPWPL